ncbi:hypothetical protein X975_11929, partial [Stegodyphus mimosarum]
MTLSRPFQKNKIVAEIKQIYLELRKKHILNLHWIKARVGHHGSERADALAKDAALGGGVGTEKVSIQDSKKETCAITEDKLIKDWKSLWDLSERNKYFPTCLKVRKEKKGEV